MSKNKAQQENASVSETWSPETWETIFKKKAEDTLQALKNRFSDRIRVGRVSPHMLDHILVSHTGSSGKATTVPLNSVATVSVIDHKTLKIQAWGAPVSAVEKVLRTHQTGSLRIEGDVIFVAMPDLTTESREKYKKEAESIAHDIQASLEKNRHECKKALESFKKHHSEDDIKRWTKTMEKHVADFKGLIEKELKAKIAEILK